MEAQIEATEAIEPDVHRSVWPPRMRRFAFVGLFVPIVVTGACLLRNGLGNELVPLLLVMALLCLAGMVAAFVGMRGARRRLKVGLVAVAVSCLLVAGFDLLLSLLIVSFPKC